MVTMRDIAEKAGVSQPAVSMILNGKSRQVKISESTRERVLALAESMGYRVNAIARSMRTGRTGVVGLLLREQVVRQWGDGVSDAENNLRLQGELLRQGFKLLLAQVSDADIAAGRLPEIVTGGYVDALMLSGIRGTPEAERYMKLLGKACPHLLVINEIHESQPSINRDNHQAGRLAAEYLCCLGHRRMAVIGCAERVPDLEHRLEGFRARLRELAPDAPEAAFFGAPNRWDSTCGEIAVGMMLEQTDVRPTAILGVNDFFALGALRELKRRGIRVPEEMSLIGIGELPQAARENPALTTVCMDVQEELRLTVEMLRQLLAGEKPEVIHRLLPCRIEARASCAPAKIGMT